MKNSWEQQPSDAKENEKVKSAKLVKSILAAIPFVFALSGIAEGASAEKNLDNNSKKEIIQSNKEQAIAFLGKLFNIPEQKNAPTPSADTDIRKQVAKFLIENYITKRIGSPIDSASPEDILKAINELWTSVPSYADQVCGDKNGEASSEDMEALEKKLGPSNPGLEALDEMHTRYEGFKKWAEQHQPSEETN